MSRDSTVVRAAWALLTAVVAGGAWLPARAAAQTFRPDSAAARLNARSLPPDPPRAVDLPEGGVTVPLATPVSRPIIDVTVDGRGPYRFVVETGSASTAVTPRVAAAAGLVPADTADPAVTVGALGVGAARLRDFRVAVLDAPAPGLDGILGLNAYRDLLLTVDYPAGVVRLERGALEPPNGRDRLALLPADDLWEFEITVNGRRTRAVLDTQGSGAFNVTPAAARGIRFAAPPVATGTVHGPGIGVQPIHSARLAGDVHVGDVVFHRPLVGLVPMPPGYPEHWNAGGPALSQFVLTLDQRNRVLRLARPGRAAVAAPPALRLAGFAAPMRGGRRVVTAVTPGGHAEARGLRGGDEVVLVDGAPAAALAADAWSARLRRAGALPLRVRRDGRELDLVLEPPVVVR
jgi:predicted aspartyl protease